MRKLLALFLLALPVLAQVDIQFQTTATDSLSKNSYTFSSQAIGTAASDRCVVVVVHGRDSGTTADITGVTIGGNSAALLINSKNTASQNNLLAIASLLVTSGTTADVVVNYDEDIVRMGIAVFAVYGASSCSTMHDTDVQNSTSNAIDVAANGGVISGFETAAGTTNTWSGITEAYDISTLTAFTFTGGSHESASSETGRSITATPGTSTAPILASVSFTPAATASRRVYVIH